MGNATIPVFYAARKASPGESVLHCSLLHKVCGGAGHLIFQLMRRLCKPHWLSAEIQYC